MGLLKKTNFPNIHADKNHHETLETKFHGDFYNAIIFRLDTKTAFCNRLSL